MAKALVQSSVVNSGQIGARQFRHGEPGVTSQALTRPQACFKTSLRSNNLQLVSSARNHRQITKAENRQGGQPSSSFFGVSLERDRCIADRHSERLNGTRSRDKCSHLQLNRQFVIKAEGKSGSDGLSKLEVVGNGAKTADSVLEDQFNRFAKAILSQDERLAEQVIEEMGYSGDSMLEEQFERFKKAMAEKDDETAEQVMKEMGYSGDSALEDQFNQFAKSLLSKDGGTAEQGMGNSGDSAFDDEFNLFAKSMLSKDDKTTEQEMRNFGDSALDDQFNLFAKSMLSKDDETPEQEMRDIPDPALEDQFHRFAKAMAMNDDGMAEQVLKEMGHSVDINEMKGLVNEVSDMQDQLQQLTDQVVKLTEEGDSDSALGLIEANLEVIAEQLEAGYKGMEQIAMLDTLASLRLSMGEIEEAEKILDQIKGLMEDVGIDSLQPLADRILEHMGTMYTEIGKPEEGLPLLLKSLEIQEDLVGYESPLIVDTLLGLASTYHDMEESANAIDAYNRIVSIIEKTKGSTDETLALPLSKLGQCLLEDERVAEAEVALQRALKLVEQKYGAKDGRVGVAKCALARVYATRGSVDEAVSLYHEGMQIMERCSQLDDDDASMETARADLAELLSFVDRNDEAEELWEANLVVKEKLFGPNHPSLIVHLQNLATAYAVGEKHDKCVPLLRRSLKLAVEDLGPDAPQVSVPLEMLATALHHLDRLDEAEPIARRALHIREAHFDHDSAVIGEACNCLASILHASGKFEEALALMKRVLEIQEKELGPHSPQLVLSLELIIMLLDRAGRADEIEPYYLRLAMLSSSSEDDGDDVDVGEENGGGFGFRTEIGGGGNLDNRPATAAAAPASNTFDDAQDSDIIDI